MPAGEYWWEWCNPPSQTWQLPKMNEVVAIETGPVYTNPFYTGVFNMEDTEKQTLKDYIQILLNMIKHKNVDEDIVNIIENRVIVNETNS